MFGETNLPLGRELSNRQHLSEFRRGMLCWDMLSVTSIVLAGQNVWWHLAAPRSGTVKNCGRDGALHATVGAVVGRLYVGLRQVPLE